MKLLPAKTKEKLKNNALILVIAVGSAATTGALNYVEARSKAKQEANDAKKSSTETVITSVTPAITELQRLVSELQKASHADKNEDTELRNAVLHMAKDIQYCKAYISFSSRGRYRPPRSTPKLPDDVARIRKHRRKRWRFRKPTARLPDSADSAEKYKKLRKKMNCSSKDPLCGTTTSK